MLEQEETISQELYEKSFQSLECGSVIKGKVMKVDSEGVLVDIGGKSDGFIPSGEISQTLLSDHTQGVQVGEEIDVVVLESGNEEKGVVLSKKRADLEKSFQRLKTAYETGEIVHATVVERVKGGLVVDLGIRGFIPGSHVGRRPVRNLDDFLGELLPLKVIEIDSAKHKVVLSHRQALEETETRSKELFWKNVHEGQVCKGRVARITNFGAFVDLGGIDGLIHLSELSWGRIKHPSDVISIGQEVTVLVLRLEKEKGKISLSLRSTQTDPWENIPEKCQEGAIITGRVTKIAKNFVFVEVAAGIEGLVSISELDIKRVVNPSAVVKEDEEIKVKVIEILQNERRMTLSRRQALTDQETKEVSNFLTKQSLHATTIGELVGKSLQSSITGETTSR